MVLYYLIRLAVAGGSVDLYEAALLSVSIRVQRS